jgi:hypothetical protein
MGLWYGGVSAGERYDFPLFKGVYAQMQNAPDWSRVMSARDAVMKNYHYDGTEASYVSLVEGMTNAAVAAGGLKGTGAARMFVIAFILAESYINDNHPGELEKLDTIRRQLCRERLAAIPDDELQSAFECCALDVLFRFASAPVRDVGVYALFDNPFAMQYEKASKFVNRGMFGKYLELFGPERAHKVLAEAFLSCDIEMILWQRTEEADKYPWIVDYNDAFLYGHVSTADYLATLDRLETRLRLARPHFVARGEKQNVKMADEWLSDNFKDLREAVK